MTCMKNFFLVIFFSFVHKSRGDPIVINLKKFRAKKKNLRKLSNNFETNIQPPRLGRPGACSIDRTTTPRQELLVYRTLICKCTCILTICTHVSRPCVDLIMYTMHYTRTKVTNKLGLIRNSIQQSKRSTALVLKLPIDNSTSSSRPIRTRVDLYVRLA